MTYLSIFEKFKILFDLLVDYKFILIFSIILLLFTFLYIIKKINTNRYILFMFLSFIIIFGISIFNNYDILSNTFDNFATIFFGNIYFPSIYVYIGVLVASFVSFVVSMFNVMLKKIYKVINTIMFVINNIFFAIILNIIAKNKIDIFSINSLYTNIDLVVLLELSMGLCIVWLLSLIIAYVTNIVCDRMAVKNVKDNDEKQIFNPILELSVSDDMINDVNNLTDVIFDNNKDNVEFLLEGNLQEDNVFVDETTVVECINNDVVGDTPVNAYVSDNVMDNNGNNTLSIIDTEENNPIDKISVTFNDILNGCVPVTYYDNGIIDDDYEMFDPQMIYEDNYNKIKCENNIVADSDVAKNISLFNDVIVSDIEEKQLSVEERSFVQKEMISKERLITNTVSLNDLIEEENIIPEIEIKDNYKDGIYTIDDYRKIMEMLNSIKSHSINSNINIDDAVAISLISNYSVDDCLKFKNLLENNLN